MYSTSTETQNHTYQPRSRPRLSLAWPALFLMDRCSLRLHSFRSLDLADEVDVLVHSALRPDAPAQCHGGDLEKDLELRRQSAVDPRGRGQPVREALERAVEESVLQELLGEGRGPRRTMRRGRGLRGWRRGRRELEGMRHNHDHMGEDRNGAELMSPGRRQ